MELRDYWRIFNCVLATMAFVWLMLDLRVIHNRLSSRRLYLTFSLSGLLFAVMVGSIENIAQNNHAGIRTAITTASCVWCLLGLWVSRDDLNRRDS